MKLFLIPFLMLWICLVHAARIFRALAKSIRRNCRFKKWHQLPGTALTTCLAYCFGFLAYAVLPLLFRWRGPAARADTWMEAKDRRRIESLRAPASDLN